MFNILKKKLLLISFLSLLFISYNLYSSPTGDPCDENWGNPLTIDFNSLATQYPNLGSVIYYQRTNQTGEIELKFDWNSLVNNFPGEISNTSLMDIFEKYLVKQVANGNNPTNVHVLYKSKCKTDVKCTIHIESSMASECCDEGFEGNPTKYEKNSEWYYDKIESRECGEKCCEIVYQIVFYYDTIRESWFPSIAGSYKNELTDCIPIVIYYDSETGLPLPCTGGCE